MFATIVDGLDHPCACETLREVPNADCDPHDRFVVNQSVHVFESMCMKDRTARAWTLPQYSLRAIFLTCALAAAILGVLQWFSRSALRVSEAPDARNVEYCLLAGVVPAKDDAPQSEGRHRIVCSVTGRLWHNRAVDASLFLVKGGAAQKLSSVSASDAHSGLPVSFVRYQLIFFDRRGFGHQDVALGVRGHTRGAASGSTAVISDDVRIGRVVRTRINSSQGSVAYVEGDRLPVVRPTMTIAEFTQANPMGEYLVIVVRERGLQ